MELAQLREALKKVAPTALGALPERPVRPSLPTGQDELDRVLAGGVPLGEISELAGPSSSGKTALALTVAAERTRAGQLVAYVDGRGQLYPPAAAALGVSLERLLIVRPPSGTARDLFRAADILLRSRSFALVVIDMPTDRKRIALSASQRLRTAASRSKTAVVLLCERPNTIDTAAVRAHVRRRGGGVTLAIHKGSAGGGLASASFRCKRYHLNSAPSSATAAATDRVLPGVELAPPPEAAANHQLVPPSANAGMLPPREQRAGLVCTGGVL